MVFYFNNIGDEDYVKLILDDLEKEYIFWRENCNVEVEVFFGKYNLLIYVVNMDILWLEFYYEDFYIV